MIKTEEGELFFSTAQKIFKLYEKVIPDEISSGHDFFARLVTLTMLVLEIHSRKLEKFYSIPHRERKCH